MAVAATFLSWAWLYCRHVRGPSGTTVRGRERKTRTREPIGRRKGLQKAIIVLEPAMAETYALSKLLVTGQKLQTFTTIREGFFLPDIPFWPAYISNFLSV
jgi:hypothetical protein